MNNYYFEGDPLEGTQWENLTFYQYYDEMSDDEKKELRDHLERINSPYGSDILDEVDPEGSNTTWRDIVSMSDEELEDYSHSRR